MDEQKNLKPIDLGGKMGGEIELPTIDVKQYVGKKVKIEKAEEVKGKPSIIIAHTIKGKGVSFMENTARWHGGAPTEEELKRALEELKD